MRTDAWSKVNTLPETPFIEQRLNEVVVSIHVLTGELEHCQQQLTTEYVKTWLAARRLIEYRVFEMLSTSLTADIHRCYYLAAQVYINQTFRTFGRGDGIPIVLAIRLRNALVIFWQSDKSTEQLLELLLWMAFVGGAVCGEGALRIWFLSFIHLLTTKLALCSWKDVHYVLVRRLLTVPLAMECKRLWLELEDMAHLGIILHSKMDLV